MSRTGRIGMPVWRPGVAVLSVWAVVASCGKAGDTRSVPAQQQAAPPQPVAQQPAPPQPAPQPAAAPPTAAPSTPAGGLATTNGEIPDAKVVVTELKRGPNTVTLKFTMVNGSADKDISFDQFHEYGRDGNSVTGIHLIDAAGKKKYFVQRDGDGNGLCSSSVGNVPHSGQISLWAKFPAPPDEVQKITVEIPHFIPMEDVPISR